MQLTFKSGTLDIEVMHRVHAKLYFKLNQIKMSAENTQCSQIY